MFKTRQLQKKADVLAHAETDNWCSDAKATAQAEATAMLEAAQEEAREIVEAAQTLAENNIQLALKNAESDQAVSLSAQANLFENALSELEADLTGVLRDAMLRLFDTNVDDTLLAGALRVALRRHSAVDGLMVRVGPAFAQSGRMASELLPETVELIIDPSLDDNSMLLDGPHGTVDISVRAQADALFGAPS